MSLETDVQDLSAATNELLDRVRSLLDLWVDATTHGAVGDGVTDCTLALRAAAATGKSVRLPKGRYKITGKITLSAGQYLFGEAKSLSYLVIDSTFNMADAGVVALTYTAPGRDEQSPAVLDLTMEFAQPDSANLADMVQYPPAIYAMSCPRGCVDNVRVISAWDGVELLGNSGGFIVGTLEVSAFNRHMLIDDALDVIRARLLHFWPWGLTANQTTAWRRNNNIGLQVNRCDGLHIGDMFAIYLGRALYCTDHGNPFHSTINITKLTLDDSGMEVEGRADVVVAAAIFGYTGQTAHRSLLQRGGSVTIASLQIRVLGTPIIGPIMEVLPSAPGTTFSGTAALSIAAVNSYSGAIDATILRVNPPSAGVAPAQIAVAGFNAHRLPNTAYTKPTIHIVRARGSISGVTGNDKGTGAGTLIKIEQDDHLSLGAITPVGWAIELPANAVSIRSNGHGAHAYSPVVTAGGGSIAGTTAAGAYSRFGDFLRIDLRIVVPANSGTTQIIIPLPTGLTTQRHTAMTGSNMTSGSDLRVVSGPGNGALYVTRSSDNGYPVSASGGELWISGMLAVA